MSCLPAAAVDWISIGAKVGTPTASPTGVPSFIGSDESKWILMGPSVELKLPRGIAVEVDALYQRTGYSQVFFSTLPDSQNTTVTGYRIRGNDWQFPFLGKYYFHRTHKFQPFVSAGPAIASTWNNIEGSFVSIASGQNLVNINQDTMYRMNYSYRKGTNVGVVAAAGARIKWKRLGLLPEVRYCYWGNAAYPRPKNTVTLLMGVQF